MDVALHIFQDILGHEPITAEPYPEIPKCSQCRCWLGSEIGNNPCGDPLGYSITTTPVIYQNRHAWKDSYKGVTLGFRFLGEKERRMDL